MQYRLTLLPHCIHHSSILMGHPLGKLTGHALRLHGLYEQGSKCLRKVRFPVFGIRELIKKSKVPNYKLGFPIFLLRKVRFPVRDFQSMSFSQYISFSIFWYVETYLEFIA